MSVCVLVPGMGITETNLLLQRARGAQIDGAAVLVDALAFVVDFLLEVEGVLVKLHLQGTSTGEFDTLL